MTAKELIAELQAILDARGGEDIELILDVDSVMHYPLYSAIPLEDFKDGSPDVVILSSYEAVEASLAYDPRIIPFPDKLGTS